LRGETDRALALYREASELDTLGGSIARLASVGEAVVAEDPERSLGRAIRRAARAGDHDAAAVGLEERARIRRAAGARMAAARDLCAAAARYGDAVDRARVAHQLADLFIAADDPHAAREALLFALNSGDRTQRDHARARLHTVSRDVGDQVGMRRWRSFSRPTMVSLSSRANTPRDRSAEPVLTRWRARIERTLPALLT
jgi:thioredoxin-like negative regulator of GroEL